jgi:hypothetical protein
MKTYFALILLLSVVIINSQVPRKGFTGCPAFCWDSERATCWCNQLDCPPNCINQTTGDCWCEREEDSLKDCPKGCYHTRTEYCHCPHEEAFLNCAPRCWNPIKKVCDCISDRCPGPCINPSTGECGCAYEKVGFCTRCVDLKTGRCVDC